jgi:membrane protein implicated in regulation of membrane protease activity
MLIVTIGWLFVVGLFALAHATAPEGTWLGAAVTLVVVGVLPVALLAYLTLAPSRRRRSRASSTPDPDSGGHAPGDAVAPEREEP